VAELHPGAFHLRAYLTLAEQARLLSRCLDLGKRPAGFYAPTVRSGGKMSLQMMCLGRHWNAKTYRYEAMRSDHDGLPVQELPEDLAQLARRVAGEVGMKLEPDICLVNLYAESAKLGLHQDHDESPESLAAGIPVVSLSVGDTAEFLLGGTARKDPVETLELRSGDALVLGGPSRLRFHGVAAIHPHTAPQELHFEGRLSLTFRQY
jgi:DNA alkylation damage repair protein AlkB